MFQTISSFEFFEWDGVITLVADCSGDPTDLEPVFLISAFEPVGYLRRKPGQVCLFRGIDPTFVHMLRGAEILTVMEKNGRSIELIYDAEVGLLEYDRDASAVRKVFAVFWHKLARWSGAEQAP